MYIFVSRFPLFFLSVIFQQICFVGLQSPVGLLCFLFICLFSACVCWLLLGLFFLLGGRGRGRGGGLIILMLSFIHNCGCFVVG